MSFGAAEVGTLKNLVAGDLEFGEAVSVSSSVAGALISNAGHFVKSSASTLFVQGSGSGTVAVQNLSGATADVNGGTINFAAGSTFSNAGALTLAAGTNLTVNGPLDGGGTIVRQDIGQLKARRLRQATLTINGNGTVELTPDGTDANVSTLSALSMSAQSSFDLNDNDLLIDYPPAGPSPLPTVQGRINTARNGGAWDGPTGLKSTAAKNAPQHNRTLGAMEATDFTAVNGAGAMFDGQTLDGSGVLIKFTYYGDANFNGVVNFDDYVRIDLGFNLQRSGWVNGDFNGSGQVNFDDYVLIDIAFNTQSGVLSRAFSPLGGTPAAPRLPQSGFPVDDERGSVA
jgi:hypothetical protein